MILEDEQLLASRFSTIKEVGDLPKGKVRSKELVKETLVIRGVQQTVHRYYVTYAGGFRGVGWIIDSEINFCMICHSEFGFFLRKHHCRSCGNILCHSCSQNFVIIEEMYELGEQRVCDMCYWGQVSHSSLPLFFLLLFDFFFSHLFMLPTQEKTMMTLTWS